MMISKRRVAAAVLAAFTLVAAAACATEGEQATNGSAWSAAWSAAAQRPSAGFGPNWSEAGFSDQTVRQVVRVTNGGDSVRIKLSNRFGASPLEITGAAIAEAKEGAAVLPASVRALTFGDAASAVVPTGAEIASDAVELPVDALDSVAVTLYLKGTTGPATFHSQAWTDTYRAAGDHLSDTAATAFTERTNSWYYLTDIEVAGDTARRDTVVAFGDSITDGFGATPGANRRWPDALADRLTAANRQQAVLNLGIGGNLVLNDSAWYGERSAARFQRDVLDKPGVRTVILLAGVNDIGFSEAPGQPTYQPGPDVTAEQLIDGYRALIAQARAAGIRVVGATLLPLGGSDHYSARASAKWHAVNDWIRDSGEYDAVVDWAAALADPNNPEALAPAYDSGDHLHPNDAGYRLMAETIDLETL
ncbi:SGNH/GDSL hydrolase family protein [Nocardia crassostreae]|uniref:SGNH/GDSL hydrolase family protein n=1 Tax=Nocardia crassostreae TaxID=53428 RepID=UPI0008297662|nr:SGNH/GDSL hydrolase family protein [Nocardia crassostreae]